jgi:apolipoprotein D and lipocalin family protein
MKKSILLLMLTIARISFSQEVSTVRNIDLNKYLGKWYEIPSIPQFFQRNCVANTTAQYGIDTDGNVSVYNSCSNKNGKTIDAKGHAKVVDPNSNAKLKVTFLKLGGWIFIPGGNYWVLELEKNYNWAVVGDPTRKTGWILSRTPSLEIETLKQIREKIEVQGYDSCKFYTTRQNGGFETHHSLCEIVQ